MTDTQQLSGWSRYDHLSPRLRARQLADDRDFEAARQADARRRAEYAEYAEQQRIRAAVELAEARGEYVSMSQVARTGGACLGRTRGEAIAYYSAVQDAEDARERARQRTQYDPQQHQALVIATSPAAVGRTREEARAYYSALADLQDMEAARRQQLELPTVEQEKAEAARTERQDARYARRALEQRIHSIAQHEARRTARDEWERQYVAGEITEAQLRELCRAQDAS